MKGKNIVLIRGASYDYKHRICEHCPPLYHALHTFLAFEFVLAEALIVVVQLLLLVLVLAAMKLLLFG